MESPGLGTNPCHAARFAQRKRLARSLHAQAERPVQESELARDVRYSLDMLIDEPIAILGDLRFAIRSLRRSPGFALIAIITLGLGIGANTSAFSIPNEVLLRPPPYPDSDRLDRIYRVIPQNSRGSVSPADYLDLKSEMNGYGEIAAYAYSDMNLSEPGEPADTARGLRISANLFSTLGTGPQLGRSFRPDETVLGNHRVLIISYRFWQNRFGGDGHIIGRTVRVDGEAHEIVGVLPATLNDWRHLGPFGTTMAALAPDLPVRELQPAETTIAKANYQWQVVGSMLSFLAVLGLGLACLGIYGVITRTIAQRTGEFGIRLALGAQVRDITRLVLTSGAKLALIGSAIGLLGAFGISRLVAAFFPGMQTNSVLVLSSVTVLLIAIALIACYMPARYASRISPMEALRAE